MPMETEWRAKRYRIRQLRDDLLTIPDEVVGTAYKNILSESRGIIIPTGEKNRGRNKS